MTDNPNFNAFIIYGLTLCLIGVGLIVAAHRLGIAQKREIARRLAVKKRIQDEIAQTLPAERLGWRAYRAGPDIPVVDDFINRPPAPTQTRGRVPTPAHQ